MLQYIQRNIYGSRLCNLNYSLANLFLNVYSNINYSSTEKITNTWNYVKKWKIEQIVEKKFKYLKFQLTILKLLNIFRQMRALKFSIPKPILIH